MNEEKIVEFLKKTGVIMDGHFLLTSGKHSGRFLQCSQLLQYPEYAALICKDMAEPFQSTGVDTVIGPAMGGVILSYEVARNLGARSLFAEPADGKMILKRGFKINPGEKVLVVEDAVTTGGSVQKVIDLLETLEAELVGVSIIVDRSAGQVNFGVATSALVQMEIDSYDPGSCPYCQEQIPLVKPKS